METQIEIYNLKQVLSFAKAFHDWLFAGKDFSCSRYPSWYEVQEFSISNAKDMT